MYSVLKEDPHKTIPKTNLEILTPCTSSLMPPTTTLTTLTPHIPALLRRIVAKEKDGELTGGQASTLVRNERAIEKLAEEIEDLEDEIQESVSATVSGRAKVGVHGK